jgi:septal ring factor EnvC (AmiA/AmiB activator)
MGTLTKIMVILTFLLAVGLALVSLKVAGRLSKQDAIIASLTATGETQKGLSSSFETVVATSKQKVGNLSAEIETVQGELAAAQADVAKGKESLIAAQNEKDASVEEVATLTAKNTALTGMVAAEKAKATEVAKVAKPTGRKPVGRVMSVTPEKGITAYFSGTATVRDGDSMNVYREKKNVGKVVVGKVKQTIVIYSEGEGSSAVPVKGDLIRK